MSNVAGGTLAKFGCAGVLPVATGPGALSGDGVLTASAPARLFDPGFCSQSVWLNPIPRTRRPPKSRARLAKEFFRILSSNFSTASRPKGRTLLPKRGVAATTPCPVAHDLALAFAVCAASAPGDQPGCSVLLHGPRPSRSSWMSSTISAPGDRVQNPATAPSPLQDRRTHHEGIVDFFPVAIE